MRYSYKSIVVSLERRFGIVCVSCNCCEHWF